MSASTEPTSDLTRLTVNLVPKAVGALQRAADMTGDTRTDTVNRSLQMYAVLVQLAREPGRFAVVADLAGDGRTHRIKICRQRWWHRLLAREIDHA